MIESGESGGPLHEGNGAVVTKKRIKSEDKGSSASNSRGKQEGTNDERSSLCLHDLSLSSPTRLHRTSLYR